jgi:O-acetyl-ADP-ribose deacetylase (regulator of RNase III)
MDAGKSLRTLSINSLYIEQKVFRAKWDRSFKIIMAFLSFEPLNQAIGKTMKPVIVYGNLLDQDVQVIVNAWNRNIIPWWLLLPQGVSGAIKKKGGIRPFRELSKHGPIPLGQAVLTGAGRLPFEGIIHVAGINMLWHASERSIRGSVQSAMDIVDQHGFRSVAFPIIGAGSGRFKTDKALELMLDEFLHIKSGSVATIVKYRKT